jgi:hypothetical protein
MVKEAGQQAGWRHNIQHNDIQYNDNWLNDTQYNVSQYFLLLCWVPFIQSVANERIMLGVVMLIVVMLNVAAPGGVSQLAKNI